MSEVHWHVNDNICINIASLPKIVCALICQRLHLTCHDKNDVMTLYLNELI